MADRSLKAWDAAKAAFADTRQGMDVFPMMYFGLVLIFGVQQFLIGPLTRKNEADAAASDLIPLLGGFALSILLIPIAISLLRYFAAGDYSRPYSFARPFGRALGWTIALCLLAALAAVPAAAGALIAFPVSNIAGLAWIAFSFCILIWVGFRLSTLYTALALDEPAPILGRSFRETKGFVWFIIRLAFSSLAVFLPLSVALGAIQYMLFGTYGLELPPGAPDASLAVRLADSAATGILSGAMMAFWLALAARVFIVVRGQ